MKKLGLILFTLLIVASCTNKKSENYISLSGKLENNTDTLLIIAGNKGIIKKIKLDSTGVFKDTLKVEKADIYSFMTSSNNRAPIYLKNGFNLNLTGDSNNFMKSFKFTGNGSSNSNFIIAQILKSQSLGNPQAILNLEKEAFDKKVISIKKEYDSILNSYKDIDSTLSQVANLQTERLIMYLNNTYYKPKTDKGEPSPKFKDYVDIKGGTKSLDSFLGKYVYIDIWATWCGPCIQQIPYLQSLEKEYHNKNIVFVSISTDESSKNGNSWENAEKKWRNFVNEKQMGGVQLWAGKDFSFQQAYEINAIPRFILIDPQGKIVSPNAPRPSDPKLKELFTSLGI